MKTKALLSVIICGSLSLASMNANAQTVTEQTVVVTELPCDTHYYAYPGDNWFIQLGSGMTVPFVENSLNTGSAERHITMVYNLGMGRWCSPYFGWRLGFMGGKLRWDSQKDTKSKWINANLDLMWDMFNTFGNVNPDRRFSIVPFVGVGGAYTWDIDPISSINVMRDGNKKRTSSWTLPVSVGLQMRMRVNKYIDFFAEGRAQFMGDNFNNYTYGAPIDANLSLIGGMTFKLGGKKFYPMNTCDYTTYIGRLNDEINDLRADLAIVTSSLADAEAQLPCPEVVKTVTEVIETQAPLMATVRFALNSAEVPELEKVNIYNAAQWMIDNPGEQIVLMGYADKGTGTSDYNRTLAQRRAETVGKILVNEYGIDPDRIAIEAVGSDVQPYETNSWNRIVIMTNAD